MELIQRVASVFKEKFKSQPVLYIAPGRINLIGEHTDYNDGFVMPSAIDKYMVFALAPSGSDRCNIYAADYDEGVTFQVKDLNPGQTWVNYLMGVIDGFQRRGLLPKGVDCVFGSNIPAGAGLSSSAALCSGFGFALNKTCRLGLSRLDLAKIGQSAEQNFLGVNVGIMDEYASLFSHHASVLLLDCRSLVHEVVPVNFSEYQILLIDTHVIHSHVTSAYNDRREACEEGVAIISQKEPDVKSLRDVSATVLKTFKAGMTHDIYEKCLYVVDEIDRTQRAAGLLKAGDLIGFGDLMYQTHWGLSKLYKVSCEESDLLVKWAEEHRDKVLGARQMGGGFGGCTINIIHKDFIAKFQQEIRKKYANAFNKDPGFYPVKLADGVHQLSAY
jgi:galactokinase